MSEVSSGRQTPVPSGSHRSSLSSGGAPPAAVPATGTGNGSATGIGSGTGRMAKSMSCGGYRYTSGALHQVHLAPLGRTYLFEQFLGTLISCPGLCGTLTSRCFAARSRAARCASFWTRACLFRDTGTATLLSSSFLSFLLLAFYRRQGRHFENFDVLSLVDVYSIFLVISWRHIFHKEDNLLFCPLTNVFSLGRLVPHLSCVNRNIS